MNRNDFFHLLRAASTIVESIRASRGIDVENDPETILIIGSQSIHATFHEDYLPEETTLSQEMDISFLPSPADGYGFDDPEQEFADLVEWNLGEDTHFRDSFGIYGQGVTPRTAYLPDGWEARLVEVHGRAHGIKSRVLCLDPYDLCAAKLTRLAPNDRLYVSSLIRDGIIDPEKLSTRVEAIHRPEFTPALRQQAESFLDMFIPDSDPGSLIPDPTPDQNPPSPSNNPDMGIS